MEKENGRTIDLVDLLFFVLEKWRWLILAGLIGMVLLGSIKLYQAETNRKSDTYVSEAYEKKLQVLQEAEKEVRDLENQIGAQNVIITKQTNNINSSKATEKIQQNKIELIEKNRGFVEDKMAELQNYMEKSLLMNVDASAKPVAKQVYRVGYVRDPVEIRDTYRDPIDEIVSLYTVAFNFSECAAELAKKYDVDPEYLAELISVSASNGPNTIIVNASGISEEMAKDLLQSACSVIELRSETVEMLYPDFKLERIYNSYSKEVDMDLTEKQTSKLTEMNNYTSKIANYDNDLLTAQKAIDDIHATVEDYELQISKAENTIINLNNQLAQAQKTVKKAETALNKSKLTRKGNLKAAVKQGLVGFVVFAFLAAGVWFLIYLFDGKMHIAEDMNGGRPVLAVMNRTIKKGSCFFDRWIYRMRNRNYASENGEIVRTAAVAVAGLLTGEKRIAVMSSLESGELEIIADSLKLHIPEVEFVFIAKSFTSARGAEELNNADAVIFFEKREVSGMRKIRAELEQVKLQDKRILGSIVA